VAESVMNICYNLVVTNTLKVVISIVGDNSCLIMNLCG